MNYSLLQRVRKWVFSTYSLNLLYSLILGCSLLYSVRAIADENTSSIQLSGFAQALNDTRDEIYSFALEQSEAEEFFKSEKEVARMQIPRLLSLLSKDQEIPPIAANFIESQSHDPKVFSDIVKIAASGSFEAESFGIGVLEKLPKSYQALALKELEKIPNSQIPPHSQFKEFVEFNNIYSTKEIQNFIAQIDNAKPVSVTKRKISAETLGTIGEPAKEAIVPLINIMSESKGSKTLRRVAIDALKKLSPYDDNIGIKLILKISDAKDDVFFEGAASIISANQTIGPQTLSLLLIAASNESLDITTRKNALNIVKNIPKASTVEVPALMELLNDRNSEIRALAAEALGAIGEESKDAIPQLIELLKDEDVRMSAVKALGNIGAASEPTLPLLFRLRYEIELLSTSDLNTILEAVGNIGVHRKDVEDFLLIHALGADAEIYIEEKESAVRALSRLDFLPKETSIQLISHILNSAEINREERFISATYLSYLLTRGDPTLAELVRILTNDEAYIDTYLSNSSKDKPEIIKQLKAFEHFLSNSEIKKNASQGRKIGEITSKLVETSLLKWEMRDVPFLIDLKLSFTHKNLELERKRIDGVIEKISNFNKIKKVGLFLMAHMAGWIIFIYLYPRSTTVQAVFFWNPWVRKVAGFGYVGFLLTWIPFLRRILFLPFADNLKADAQLNEFEGQRYFTRSNVVITNDEIIPIHQALSNMQGHIILEGASGLGKSMALRYHVKTSKKIITFLHASRCYEGVLPAIQCKLQGLANDEGLLKALIYSGAMDICIDGINEVSADVRANITSFAESFSKGNIIMTTQPIEWIKPLCSKTWTLLPLSVIQIEEFLFEQRTEKSKLSETEYRIACRDFLDKHDPHDDAGLRSILSNPLDLTVIAQLIQNGIAPEISDLRQQQFNVMDNEYQKYYGSPFPLERFSEYSFNLRKNDQIFFDIEFLDNPDIKKSIPLLLKHKIIIASSTSINVVPDYKFRHDKIMDYFITQTFLGEHADRQRQYVDDSRFRGVYFMLADRLPLNEAEALREILSISAAESKDHTTSDIFVLLLRDRKVMENNGDINLQQAAN